MRILIIAAALATIAGSALACDPLVHGDFGPSSASDQNNTTIGARAGASITTGTQDWCYGPMCFLRKEDGDDLKAGTLTQQQLDQRVFSRATAAYESACGPAKANSPIYAIPPHCGKD